MRLLGKTRAELITLTQGPLFGLVWIGLKVFQ